jgi:hypothetical protein
MVIWYFQSHLLNCIAIWYILWSFGIFLPFWYVVGTNKNLANLPKSTPLVLKPPQVIFPHFFLSFCFAFQEQNGNCRRCRQGCQIFLGT